MSSYIRYREPLVPYTALGICENCDQPVYESEHQYWYHTVDFDSRCYVRQIESPRAEPQVEKCQTRLV